MKYTKDFLILRCEYDLEDKHEIFMFDYMKEFTKDFRYGYRITHEVDMIFRHMINTTTVFKDFLNRFEHDVRITFIRF